MSERSPDERIDIRDFGLFPNIAESCGLPIIENSTFNVIASEATYPP